MLEPPQPAGSGDYVVRAGESIASIAAQAGHATATIWDDPANAALREARGDPELLLPGDRVTVPAPRPKRVACATGKRHVFRRTAPEATVTIVLEDEEGQPFAGKRYEVELDATKRDGSTDEAGTIVLTVPLTLGKGVLRVWLEEPGYDDPLERELAVGHLHPLRHPLGMQQRLANLGFYRGALDGTSSAELLEAALAFAAAAGLKGVSDIDESLVAKLAEVCRA